MVDSLPQLAASASNRFEERYGRAPRWTATAPGRVNLIGEHVDYNDGLVLPMAIDRYCVIAAADAPGRNARVFSSETDEEIAISLAGLPQQHKRAGHWSNYVAGVLAGFIERGVRPGGFQAVIASSVPLGGGLSSSAALEVATATLLEAMTGTTLDPVEKALLCQKAEHQYAGVPCGIMDQFTSTLARPDHLMLLDCRSHQVEHIPLEDPRITVLIANTNVQHELSGSEYAVRRRQCESAARKLGVGSLRDATLEQLQSQCNRLDSDEFRRARHVIDEIARTSAAAAAVRTGDWPAVGRLMRASHDSLRDDYEVSCAELDLLVGLARELGSQAGVIGSRMTGGGFGGCTVTLVETDKLAAVAEHLSDRYRAHTGIEPSCLTSRPARGAHIV